MPHNSPHNAASPAPALCRLRCKLPCRDEPVNEVDCFCVATLVCVLAAVAVFFVYGSFSAEVWLPLVALAVVCVIIARQCQVRDESPADAGPAA
jgi:hypothetical protein